MLGPTLFTYLLLIWGLITTLPLLYTQGVLLVRPNSQLARDLLIGKDEVWRNETHFRSALGAAWADWLVLLPLVIAGSIGLIQGTNWGYICYACAGIISVYINLILWFQEKAYVYPKRGPWIYYGYYWGNFIYWGVTAFAYCLIRLILIS